MEADQDPLVWRKMVFGLCSTSMLVPGSVLSVSSRSCIKSNSSAPTWHLLVDRNKLEAHDAFLCSICCTKRSTSVEAEPSGPEAPETLLPPRQAARHRITRALGWQGCCCSKLLPNTETVPESPAGPRSRARLLLGRPCERTLVGVLDPDWCTRKPAKIGPNKQPG